MPLSPTHMFFLLLTCLHLLPSIQGAIFLAPPKNWKPANQKRKLIKPPLFREEIYRTWLLTHSNLENVEFQKALAPNLTTVERSTHLLARHILTKFPDIILTGGYVRDVVVNNENGFTGLNFYLINDNGSGGEQKSPIILDVAASIKKFSQTNNLAATAPDCLLTTSEGGCKKLDVFFCALVDGKLDTCD